MAVPLMEKPLAVGPRSAGMLLTPAEFDAIGGYDEKHQYELVHGVLVVTPIPLSAETGPNDLLGFFLRLYQHQHDNGKTLDSTLPQQYVRTATGRRLADRLIWAGLGRTPNPRKDVATIAVEFVSAGKKSSKRDYVDKKTEYGEAGILEYWIIDRFNRTLTVHLFQAAGDKEIIVPENGLYESVHLPGFHVPLAALLEAADQWAVAEDE